MFYKKNSTKHPGSQEMQQYPTSVTPIFLNQLIWIIIFHKEH